VQLLISERARFARFAFPDERCFVASPGVEMTVETVVGDVDLAAAEPLRMRRIPLQHRVPLFEPVQLFRHARPERFRIRTGFGAKLLEFLHRLDVRVLGKRGRRREDPFFL
jgi:hypothetical protein